MEVEILLISGKSGSGKGTVASIIKEELKKNNKFNVIQCSLSTYIRQIAKDDFYWDGVDTPESRKFMGEVYRVGTEFYSFHMMRRVWERDIEPNLVNDKINIAIVESFRELVNYYYCMALRGYGKISDIKTIRIKRPGHDVTGEELKKHVSESDLDNFPFDYYIVNDSDIDVLIKNVKGIVEKYLRE